MSQLTDCFYPVMYVLCSTNGGTGVLCHHWAGGIKSGAGEDLSLSCLEITQDGGSSLWNKWLTQAKHK